MNYTAIIVALITGFPAIFGAYVVWQKWKYSQKSVKETSIGMSALGQANIQGHLERHRYSNDKIGISSMLRIRNGIKDRKKVDRDDRGAAFEEHPLLKAKYGKLTHSTDWLTYQTWTEEFRLEDCMVRAFANCIRYPTSVQFIKAEDFKEQRAKEWLKINNVSMVAMTLIGVDDEKNYGVLLIDNYDTTEVTTKEKSITTSIAAAIFNEFKHFNMKGNPKWKRE